MNYKVILQEIYNESEKLPTQGKVTSSIPELAKVNPDKFGIHLTTIAGEYFEVGDSKEKFSIKSISKVLTVVLAFSFLNEKIWERVGVEPSRSAFNSLVQVEYEKGIPRNPFINAGAIVIADILVTHLENPKQDFLDFLRMNSGSLTIDFNFKVAQSEKDTRFSNAALANF